VQGRQKGHGNLSHTSKTGLPVHSFPLLLISISQMLWALLDYGLLLLCECLDARRLFWSNTLVDSVLVVAMISASQATNKYLLPLCT